MTSLSIQSVLNDLRYYAASCTDLCSPTPQYCERLGLGNHCLQLVFRMWNPWVWTRTFPSDDITPISVLCRVDRQTGDGWYFVVCQGQCFADLRDYEPC